MSLELFEIRGALTQPRSIFVLADRARTPEPDLVVRRILDRGYRSPGVLEQLLNEAGLTLIEPKVIDCEYRTGVPTSRMVRFPADAPHDYAGREVIARFHEFDGLPYLFDEDVGQMIMPTDRPWSARSADEHGRYGLIEDTALFVEQVPLGPLLVPEEQFASPEERSFFIASLREAGYEVAP
jgi:hypothetical protein